MDTFLFLWRSVTQLDLTYHGTGGSTLVARGVILSTIPRPIDARGTTIAVLYGIRAA